MIRLARIVDDHLRMSRRTRMSLAEELGWSRSTVTRFLNSGNLDSEHLQALLIWLFNDIGEVKR